MKIWIYILIGLIAVIILLFIHGFYKRLSLLRMFYASYLKVNRSGLIIAVSGAIRSGKTTLSAGLTHLFTFKIKNDLMANLEEIEIILYQIDFTNLRGFIDRSNITLENFKDEFNRFIIKFIQADDLENYIFSHNLSKPYFDYLNYEKKINLLEKYVECYLHLNRQAYILSNIKIYNQITRSYSFEFNNAWIKLKEKQNFPLIKYSVFVEDDKLVHDSNVGYAKKLHEDSGSDIFYRLFGHLFRETSYYITTVQDVKRWLKLEREIAQTHIYVKSSSVVGNYPKLNYLLNLFERFINFIYRLLRKVSKNDRYFNNSNIFKILLFKIHQKRKKYFSKSFVYYECGIFSDIEKVGKEIKEDDISSEYFNFVLPIQYVYGVLDTHEFNVIWNYLYNRSKIKYSDLKQMEINEDEILQMLQKYNEKNLIDVSNIEDLF